MFKMQPNESITSWFDRYTAIINQLNQLGRVILEDELVKRFLRSLPKAQRSTIVAILEVKDLNKISLDKICGSLLTYEQEVNQIDEEEKKKGIALKTKSKDEELYDNSCEHEDAEMAMLARRYKKLLFNVTSEWKEIFLKEIGFVMIFQETTKSLTLVVNSSDI